MRLGENALTDDDDRRADGQLAVELDRKRIHRNGADDTARLACHADLRPGEITTEAVRVAHRHDPDPGRSLRDEVPSVAGALSRLEQLDLCKARVPRQDRLQAVIGRIGVERRQAVEGDTAARGVEVGLGQSQRARTVGDMPGQMAVLLGRDAKALDLRACELGIAVRGCEVGHQADHLGCG